ncbi:MAG: anaerobic sulfatase-maturation protein [Dysgonamonadaceae bacterium]|jgi:uncharacterized protein|nr:anaerobic sulfatase-maturation protein [Dysgonamonadaceae bacterium]
MEETFFATPFAKPLYVMLKPVGAACNLRCKYCYYLEKKNLYQENDNLFMSDATLERFIRQYLESQTSEYVLFMWHGGEAFIRNIDFYEKALKLQQKYGKGLIIENAVQTNGTLLNDKICRFLKENHFLTGISIDGPQHCHNRYRYNSAGKGSFDDVMKGLQLLNKYQIDFNVMTAVNDYNVNFPIEIYNFFKDLDCKYIQLLPVVDSIDGKPASWNVPSEKWGDFLIAIFNEWKQNDIGRIFVTLFDATLARWMDINSGDCTFSKTCGQAGVMEFNGDVYSCDHYVYPQYKLGNIFSSTITEMMYSERQLLFGDYKFNSLPQKCLECRYLFACNGGCPKQRIELSEQGEAGLNALCAGYKKYFEYVEPFMEKMANFVSKSK